MAGLVDFDGKKYLSLETYRRNGAGVRTPVWFAADGSRLYAYTTADSGKAKRIRWSGLAKIAPCDAKGTVTGDWTEVRASIVGGAAFDRGMQLLNRKYWPLKSMMDVFVSLFPRHQRVMIAIEAVQANHASSSESVAKDITVETRTVPDVEATSRP